MAGTTQSDTRQLPWLTVVTPSLNQADFIRAAIESVLVQADNVPVEHIVVEGGSTDATPDILSQYQHLTILRDPGIGQSHAVNLGLRQARGQVVGWLNADDCYLPGAAVGARRGFDEYADAGIVYGNAQFIDEEGRVVGEIRPGAFDLDKMLNGMNAVPQPAVFMRRNLLDEIGLLNESLHYVMDYELWLRAQRATRLVWIDETWAQFRRHQRSKTASREYAFWPERRAVARAYGGPFFSENWRWRTLNRRYPMVVLTELRQGTLFRRPKIRS